MTARERSALQDRVSRALLRREQERARVDRVMSGVWIPDRPRSNRYQRAVRALLAEPDRSDRSLSVKAGVSHVTIRTVRRDLEAEGFLAAQHVRLDARGFRTDWTARSVRSAEATSAGKGA